MDANCYELLEVIRFIYICFIGTGGFKSYRLLEVMGYHSMGYLRFDCIASFYINCDIGKFAPKFKFQLEFGQQFQMFEESFWAFLDVLHSISEVPETNFLVSQVLQKAIAIAAQSH